MATKSFQRTPLPQFSADERRAHLRKAAELRAQRAQVKEDFTRGKLSFLDIVEVARDEKATHSDLVCAKLRVSELIRAKPGIGRARCERIMEDLEIARTRCVGGLGHRQVQELAKIL